MDAKLQQELTKKLEDLLIKTLMDFKSIEFEMKEENVVRFNIMSDEPGMLIGKHGETLFAIQQVLRVLISRSTDFDGNVVLDIDNYRLNQEENAQTMASDIARKVRANNEAIELVPMPSYKRRAVHMMFQTDEYKDLDVYSVGEGETRRIRIAIKAE